MNNKDISVKLSDTIERQDFKRAIDAVQTLRPIDIADITALIKPKIAWQLLQQLLVLVMSMMSVVMISCELAFCIKQTYPCLVS